MNIGKNGYATPFLYSNAQFCIISNHFAFWPQSSSHDGQPCSQLKSWVLSKKGKATADIDFNPEDPPEAYSHPSIHSRVTQYTTMAREVHGPQFDPSSQDIDGEIVMRVGGGKKHGRYWIGDSVIDTASTPTLSQIRARSTDSSPAIRPRPTTAQFQIEALQVLSLPFIIRWFLRTLALHCFAL